MALNYRLIIIICVNRNILDEEQTHTHARSDKRVSVDLSQPSFIRFPFSHPQAAAYIYMCREGIKEQINSRLVKANIHESTAVLLKGGGG